ncbi:flavin-dependent monooxygenase QhpG, partial [Roseibium sp.]|uniref:flavin-dependent monooxygenase QhpG n=1 Tax=Roseibium sp. TaxID=1936156 RepID=UPI003D0965B4
LLASKGLEEALAAASAPMPRSVSWAGLTGTANGERLVRRHDFDASLRLAAVRAGASHTRARVSRIETRDPETGVVLKLSNGETITARLMVDARGRQSPSSLGLKGPRTLSVSGLLTELAGCAGTEVIATPQGWLWSAADPHFGHWVQISIDADELRGSGPQALADRMREFLRQPYLGGRFANVSFQGRLLARHAGLVLAAPELKLPVLPVGDAAVAIDPLSGHGLFWALSSALAAVPAVLTYLETPARGQDLAARFYRDRVVETFWRQARTGRDFYRLEQDLAAYPFWSRRAAWPDGAPAHAPADDARLERRVVVENNRLKERDVLVTPQDPDGVAFVAGIPVTELLGMVREDGPVRSGAPDLSPAQATALRWLECRNLRKGSLGPFPKSPANIRETA